MQQSLYEKMGLDAFFNIVLVHQGARPCCFIQRADYIMINDVARYQAVKNFCSQNLPDYGLKIYELDDGFLVCNRARSKFDTDKALGQALGFDCPGEMDGKYSITYYVSNGEKEESFYTEICRKIDPIKVQKKLKAFQKVAKQLGMSVRVGKEHYRWSTPDLIAALKSDVPITAAMLFEIGNAFWNCGLNVSVHLTEQLRKQPSGNYRPIIEKYIPVWIVLLVFSEHNPFLIFRNEINHQKVDKTWTDVADSLGEWESALYQEID